MVTVTTIVPMLLAIMMGMTANADTGVPTKSENQLMNAYPSAIHKIAIGKTERVGTARGTALKICQGMESAMKVASLRLVNTIKVTVILKDLGAKEGVPLEQMGAKVDVLLKTQIVKLNAILMTLDVL